MAQQPSSNDELLALKKRARRRLVGAVALVLISVIVLWNVLDGEPKAAKQNVNAQAVEIISDAPQIGVPGKAVQPVPAPSPFADPAVVSSGKPTASVNPAVAVAADPVITESAGAPTPPKKAKSAELKADVAVEPKKEKPAREEKKPPEKHEKPKAEPKAEMPKHEAKPVETKQSEAKANEARSDDAKSHLIQVAALSDADKAKALVARLAEHGVKAYTEQKGEVTRVRVGPFSSRELAEKTLSRVQAAGASGMIISR